MNTKSLITTLALATAIAAAGQLPVEGTIVPLGKPVPAVRRADAATPTPKKPTNLRVDVGTDSVRVSWDATTTDNLGKPLPDSLIGDLRYIVLDYFTKQVYDTIAATSWTDPRSPLTLAPPTLVQYEVRATLNGKQQIPGLKENAPRHMGHFTAPFTVDCNKVNTGNLLKLFDIVDANADKSTWAATRNYTRPGTSHYFLQTAAAANGKDDWLMVPVELKAGKAYAFSVEMVMLTNGKYTETFEVKMGTAPTTDAMTTEVLPTSEASAYRAPAWYTGHLTVPSDGVYYLGIHANTPTKQGILALDGMKIDAGYAMGTPWQPTDFSLAPDPDGTADVTVSCTTPTLNVEQNALDAITSVTILRDGEPLHTARAMTAGTAYIGNGMPYSYVDKTASEGEHTYTLLFGNAKGDGAEVSGTVYAGVNKVQPPANVRCVPQTDGLHTLVSWDRADKDIAGLDIKPEFVTYTVYETYNDVTRPVAEGLTENSVMVATRTADQPQRVVTYTVRATTRGGESANVLSQSVAVGPSQKMPWAESFANGLFDGNVGLDPGHVAGQQIRVRTLGNYNPGDADDGLMMMSCGYGGSVQGVATGWIDIEGTNPMARLYSSKDPTGLNTLAIQVDDGTGWKTLASTTTANIGSTAENDTKPFETSLKDYIGKTVRVRFTAAITGYTINILDNLMVYDAAGDDNVAVMAVRPANVTDTLLAGQPNKVYVDIRNFGSKETQPVLATVRLLRDGQEVASAFGPQLAPFTAGTVALTDDVPATLGGSTAHYTVVLESDGDATPGDNGGSLDVYVAPTHRPASTTLQASSASGKVSLAWTAPDLSQAKGETVFDDFEAYEPWQINGVGNWTLVDADQADNLGLPYVQLPFMFQKTSWMVMDDEFAGYKNYTMQFYPAASGHQAFTSFVAQNNVVDDWAITPRLYDGGQRVTLRWIGPKALRVYASTTDADTASFEPLDTLVNAYYAQYPTMGTTGTYSVYTIDIPAGVKYLAFRNYVPGHNQTVIDDITYIPALKEALEIQGYNVYRDGVRLNAEPVADTAYVDDIADDAAHTYYVTTQYATGESSPSNAVSLVASGLTGLSADEAAEVARYAVDGREADASYRGVVIVKYSDGSAKKCVTK